MELQGLGRNIHELIVLAQLKHGAMHGYEIARRVLAHSAGEVTLHHGTLYPILHRLERQQLIRSGWRTNGERRRRVYSLTHAGASHLRDGRVSLRASFNRVLSILSQESVPIRS